LSGKNNVVRKKIVLPGKQYCKQDDETQATQGGWRNTHHGVL
jgi:hypothetical protein